MALFKTAVIVLFTFIAVLLLLPLGLFSLLINCFGINKHINFILYKTAQAWARMVIFLTGCRMTVTGRENIPKKGKLCFVSNHVGIFDVVLAMAYAGRHFGFIAKKELLFLPGINIWIILLGGFFIDRRRPKKALNTINKGIERIKAGGAMLIFPEGTRTRDRGLARFHPGSLKLASKSEALIVPIAITGSYDVFERHYLVHSVPVYISFLPTVDPKELPPEDRKKILAEKLHADIAEALTQHTR